MWTVPKDVQVCTEEKKFCSYSIPFNEQCLKIWSSRMTKSLFSCSVDLSGMYLKLKGFIVVNFFPCLIASEIEPCGEKKNPQILTDFHLARILKGKKNQNLIHLLWRIRRILKIKKSEFCSFATKNKKKSWIYFKCDF